MNKKYMEVKDEGKERSKGESEVHGKSDGCSWPCLQSWSVLPQLSKSSLSLVYKGMHLPLSPTPDIPASYSMLWQYGPVRLLTSSPFTLTPDSLPLLKLYPEPEISFLHVFALIILSHLPTFSTWIIITSGKPLLGPQAKYLSSKLPQLWSLTLSPLSPLPSFLSSLLSLS